MRSSSLARVVMAGLGVSVVITLGCDGLPTEPSKGFKGLTAPTPTVTVEFGGRVVNADAGGPVESVRVSVFSVSNRGRTAGADGKEIATSGGDGTFTLPLNLPSDWTVVGLEFTGPSGYDHTVGYVVAPAAQCPISPCWTAADRPAIRMYPTLVIRPGESIEVRVDGDIVLCGMALVDLVPCRRVVVAASPGPVELEIVPHDSAKSMTLALISGQIEFPDPSVRRLTLTVPPGGVAYVIQDTYGTSTATLTARR